MARAIPTARCRRLRDSALWPAVVAAVLVHGTILETVHALGLSIGPGSAHAAQPRSQRPELDDDPEIARSCAGNAALATSGRAALCFAPWIGDVDRCLADAQLSLWMDLSSCQSRNDPRTAIAVIEQRTADKLRSIDPERLLEDKPGELVPPPRPTPPPPQVAQQPPPPAPPPPPPQQPPAQPRQIVETVKPREEKEPDNARLLSEFNTRVEQQKVARGARNEPLAAKAMPEQLTPTEKPKEEPQVAQHEPDRANGRQDHAPDVLGVLSMRSPGALRRSETEQTAQHRGSMTGAASAAADGYAARRGDAAFDQDRRDRSETPRGDHGAGGGAPDLPKLMPTREALERVAGGGSVDRLDDVANGDETALSSKRWIYAGFFNRLKRQVAQNWDPATVWRRRDPTGSVYGSRTRVTEVQVSLSRVGEIERIVVTAPSGVSELDEEAIRAFRAAGPFPNPPDGLVQRNNLITFAFSFSFEIGAPHVSWRLPAAM